MSGTVALGLLLRPSTTPTTSKSSRPPINPSLIILTVLGFVFRSELAILLGTHTIFAYLRGRLSIRTIILSGLIGVFVSSFSIPLDSYLWQRPLWPELESFLFNVYQGQSSNWGPTSQSTPSNRTKSGASSSTPSPPSQLPAPAPPPGSGPAAPKRLSTAFSPSPSSSRPSPLSHSPSSSL
ncbi:MAG: hypothetical protein LQ340_001581 [Diploschistes diacapsis]|nr:MAG: hypothetical protein LQ340_001581 [Diploschistes diacapsis]